MVNVIQFCRVVNSVCSCGRELGLLQHQIEFKLFEKNPDFSGNDKDVSSILDDMKIFRMCCRKTILCSTVYQISSMDKGVFNYRDSVSTIENADELVIHQKTV